MIGMRIGKILIKLSFVRLIDEKKPIHNRLGCYSTLPAGRVRTEGLKVQECLLMMSVLVK